MILRTTQSRCLASAALIAAASIVLAPVGQARGDDPFVRGDVNTDGQLSISDALMLRRWLFNGDRAPACHDSADFQDNGHVDLTDVVLTLVYLFLGGAAPPAPYPAAGADPTPDEWTCETYSIVQPEESSDLLRIGDVAGAPGLDVRIPVIVSNTVDIEAFQIVLAYDPALLTVQTAATPDRADHVEGGYYESREDVQGGSFFVVQPHPENGIAVVGFIPSFINEGFELPPGEDQIIFFIHATVSESAAEGATVQLDPINTGYGPAAIKNEVTHRGDARFVSLVPHTQGGILHIVGDQTFFVRGDSNGDDHVDISDAQSTLGFLFLGSARPKCLDAADANDDNHLDVSDAIATLQFLFLGAGATLPAPFPQLGLDPTPGNLGC